MLTRKNHYRKTVKSLIGQVNGLLSYSYKSSTARQHESNELKGLVATVKHLTPGLEVFSGVCHDPTVG